MSDNDIAIVGVAAHLPGAPDPAQFWRNLHDGVESVHHLSEEDLLAAGVTREVMRRPGYVRSAAPLTGVYDFDADFFGLSPKEAGIMDPQHRHFLMAVWEAMEDAGHVPGDFDGAIGVFAGCGANSYYMFNLLTNQDLIRDVGLFLLRHTGNDKDFLATRASYLFDLSGPSVNVQTACSTSLVATHLAVTNLLSGECDLALAGGVTIEIPHGQGYQYEEGEVLSPDGHCHAFDHRSQGTVFGSGVGVVAMRRLEDALADGDQIYSVVKGTAVNNDGAQKVGYLAPSVDGQAACIAEALGVADVDPATVSYVECHGTGTPMGDPIEIAALTQSFRPTGDKTGWCRIGSVKTNIGHLDTAAGVASLIKVSLALRHGELPPSLNFEQPNPQLALEDSPFVVNDRLTEWRREGSMPRRAGVNSLGVGGTNAFAVVEEPPTQEADPSDERWRLLVVSGRNKAALDANCARLAAHLRTHPDLDLADVAWTLRHGRRHFPERRVLAARTTEEAADLLERLDPRRVFAHSNGATDRRIAFMFPGGGSQYPRMAADLYAAEPVFAEHVDAGLRALVERHGLDLRPLVFPADGAFGSASEQLQAPGNQLPAIFVVEHALARLLMSWGIEPSAMVGHSVGENTAACIGGTFSFEDALGLVVLRGQLTDRVIGATLAVPAPAEELRPLIEQHGLDLAVVNAPELSVVSGDTAQIAALERDLAARGVEAQRVAVRTAAHSRLLDPILPEFRAYLDGIMLSAPAIPWVSNRTGTWITAEQATDPGYWVEHLRSTVHFSACIETLAAEADLVLLEIGPGKMLSSLARMSPSLKSTQAAIPTMRHADEVVDDEAFLVTALGRLWAVGGPLPDERIYPDGKRRRVALPTYAFQQQSFFIKPGHARQASDERTVTYLDREPDGERWYWAPYWRSQDLDEPIEEHLNWLVFRDQAGIGDEVVARLRERGDDVVVVSFGDFYVARSDLEYVLAPENGLAEYDQLVRDLVRTGRVPDRIAHLALLATDDRRFRPGSSFFHRNQELGFQSLVSIAKAWAAAGVARPLHVCIATMGSQRVMPSDVVPWPEQATVLGPVCSISRELADVTAKAFDIDQSELFPDSRLRTAVDGLVDTMGSVRAGGWRGALAARRSLDGDHERATRRDGLVGAVVAELLAPAGDEVVALRGDRRFVQDVRRITPPVTRPSPLREGGVVIVTGGLGGIGLTIAEHLFDTRAAKLALLARTPMPRRDSWDELLARLAPDHPTARRIKEVRRLEAKGAEVLVLTADVADISQMQRAVGEVLHRFGAVHGVVHAAGIVDDDLLVSKSQADMDDVLAPKVYGTLVLEDVVGDEDLDLFVVFSSTSTVTAPIGQVDYVAANAFLNAFAEARRAQGQQHVTALDWGIWNEVGMAFEAVAERTAAPPTVEPADHPLFDSCCVEGDGTARLTSHWSTERDWVLDDHRTAAGEALLPGSGYVELARAALAQIGFERPFEMRDLTFLRPLAVADGDVVEVQTELVPTEAGYQFRVRERVAVGTTNAEDDSRPGRLGWRTDAGATLLLHRRPSPAQVDLAAVRASCPEREAARTPQQDFLRFGPRWDVVQHVFRGSDRAIADLCLPERFVGDLDVIGVHPGLLDLGTGFAMSLIAGYTGDQLWVPVDYDSIIVHGPLPQDVVAVASARPGSTQDAGFASFDVALCDRSGDLRVQVEGFTIKRLDGSLDVGAGAPVAPADVEFDDPAGPRLLSPTELVLRHNASQGIRPAEGAAAFDRVLATADRPVVYVSSLDLIRLRDQTASAASELVAPPTGEASAVFARPALDSDYVAPRNDVEESLVTIWQELLGIDQVGVQDNFFELGGHSLIAVRLFARIKKLFSVEFPLSVLFEAPTIEACARLIADAQPSAGGEQAQSTVAVSRPRYDHLVAMHPGEGGPQAPFFLVAGMFGNVLNLRHLAHQVGTDRPFFGVQARGIFGDEDPYDDFVEMAAAYLAEVRLAQPEGPYLLGGFSGGGITAYEMAQQLQRAGEEVGLLVFLDTALPKDEPLTIADRVKIQRDNVASRGPSYLKEWAVNRVRWERAKRRRASVEAPTDPGALHSLAVEAAFYRALAKYELQPYDGDVTLYRPPLSPHHVFGEGRQINVHRRFLYDDNGWGPWCGHVEVIEVPGDHDSMVLEPNVRVVATHLRDQLAAFDDRRGTAAANISSAPRR